MPRQQRHFRPRPALLSGELGAKIFVIISFCRVGLGDGLCGWTGIAIQEAAVHAGHDGGRIILSKMDAVGGCGCILPRPVAAIKRLEKSVLGRDVLCGTHETGTGGAAEMASDPHTGLALKINCSSAVLPCDGSHVSPRLDHTVGVSLQPANWAEPKNAGPRLKKTPETESHRRKWRQEIREATKIFYSPAEN